MRKPKVVGRNLMKARIVRIGNSQGVRIPRLLLDQTGLQGEVEIEAENGKIVIRALDNPRHGWEESFRQMAERGEDAPIDVELGQTSWDEEEWEW
jgi:antitoxin MazE